MIKPSFRTARPPCVSNGLNSIRRTARLAAIRFKSIGRERATVATTASADSMALRHREDHRFLARLAIQRCGVVRDFEQLHEELLEFLWRKSIIDNMPVRKMSGNPTVKRALRSRT